MVFAGERYFELLRAREDWGPYLAISERVILVWEGRAYAFGEAVEEAPRGRSTATPAPPSTPVNPTVRDWQRLFRW